MNPETKLPLTDTIPEFVYGIGPNGKTRLGLDPKHYGGVNNAISALEKLGFKPVSSPDQSTPHSKSNSASWHYLLLFI